MSQRLSGTGLPLPIAQNLYPSELFNAPQDFGSNEITLAAGDALAVPPGDWYIAPGKYGTIEYLDPVTGTWRTNASAYSPRNQLQQVISDGNNFRVANRLGCPISAIVTNAGSAYVQASTTVTASAGGSTWEAIVGGMVSVTTISNAGSGYGVAPLVFIPAPPPAQSNPNGVGGVPATAHAVLTGTSVTSIVMDNWGAGYQTAPTAVILPSPYDPNINSTIVQAQVTLGLIGAGSIAAVLCTNHGAPVATAPTLTFGGVGSGASASAVIMQTLTGGSVIAAGTTALGSIGLFTIGGAPSATPVNTNPDIELTNFLPRPAQAGFNASGGSLSSIGTIYDGGMFAGTPNAFVVGVTGSSVNAILGSTSTTVIIQPAP